MTGPARPAIVLLAALTMSVSLTGCGGGSSSGSGKSEERDHGKGRVKIGSSAAADVSTCTDEATAAATPYGRAFPQAWPFPPKTVVFDSEDRGRFGTIVTGVSASSVKDVLAFMNKDVVGAGFETEDGETEERDAEAEWKGNGFRGRWAIRASGTCSGETVIQVLSTNR